MPPTLEPSPVKAAVRALADKVNDLEFFAGEPSEPRFKAALAQANQLWEQLQNVLNKSKTRTITEFFDAVGSSVVEAQGRLDEASAAYVRSTLRRDSAASDHEQGGAGSPPAAQSAPALGSLFRIPRVTAELKCSLEMNREKGFNVIFYTDRTDVRELHQQTVQLEVVAVPVPPDYLNYLKSQPEPGPAVVVQTATAGGPQPLSEGNADRQESADGPLPLSDGPDDSPAIAASAKDRPRRPEARPSSPSFAVYLQDRVVDPTERAQLRLLVEELDEQKRRASGRRSPRRELLLQSWSRVLVLADCGSTRFILLATTDRRPRLLLWKLTRDPIRLRLLGQLRIRKKSRRELARVERFFAGGAKS